MWAARLSITVGLASLLVTAQSVRADFVDLVCEVDEFALDGVTPLTDLPGYSGQRVLNVYAEFDDPGDRCIAVIGRPGLPFQIWTSDGSGFFNAAAPPENDRPPHQTLLSGAPEYNYDSFLTIGSRILDVPYDDEVYEVPTGTGLPAFDSDPWPGAPGTDMGWFAPPSLGGTPTPQLRAGNWPDNRILLMRLTVGPDSLVEGGFGLVYLDGTTDDCVTVAATLCVDLSCLIDSDGDGTPDCDDGCPDDPDKTEPGACGCGVPETDSDGDGIPDCLDPPGITVVTEPDPYALDGETLLASLPGYGGQQVYNIYVEFDEPDDQCIAVFGSLDIPFQIRTSDGSGFVNATTVGTRDRPLEQFFLDLVPEYNYDSFYTIGNRILDVGPDWDDGSPFNDELGIVPGNFGGPNSDPWPADPATDMTWWVPPTTESPLGNTLRPPQSIAGNWPDRRVLLMRLVVGPCVTVEGSFGLLYDDASSGDSVQVPITVPAPPDCNGNSIADVCETDGDGDGVIDDCDGCPDDPNKIAPGACGCGNPDTDTDTDGTADCNDGCPDDPNKTAPGDCGCGNLDTDTDGDGTADCNDNCPSDPNKTEPGVCGCGVSDVDSDGDGTPDCHDSCPNDPNKTLPGACGCGIADTDTDGDGTPDCHDSCPADPAKTVPGACGCGIADTDTDGDGTPDCHDGCPDDPEKTVPGTCGCGVADTDGDGDGTPDCDDPCPADPTNECQDVQACCLSGSSCQELAPTACLTQGGAPQGLGTTCFDSDGDGVGDGCDGCPSDPSKTEPGACGCGVPESDSDGDGTPDCNDNCPDDPGKTEPGICGCGVPETDSDSDGTPDCVDPCPDDPADQCAGIQACCLPGGSCAELQPTDCTGQGGVPRGANTDCFDTDGDGTGDECDGCPLDPNKTEPGDCGCGAEETDTDGDGTPDCNDLCPTDPSDQCLDTQACCLPDGGCLTLPIVGCVLMDGEPQGAGTGCQDSDGDLVADPCDGCPDDPLKTEPGVCGCGVPENEGDSDGDGTPDCIDACPSDPADECVPDEACCVEDDYCCMIEPAACDAIGGITQGPDSDCSGAPCPNASPAEDIDQDCRVGVSDLALVILNWGDCGPIFPCTGDVNGDGVVDVQDLGRVILAWTP